MRLVDADYILKAIRAFDDEEHAPRGWMSAMRTVEEIIEDAPLVET